MSLAVTAIGATLVAIGIVLWRVWPVVRGSARPGEPPSVRLYKWNRYLVRLTRASLGETTLVARATVFVSAADGAERSIATWSLHPTLIPDVDFIAIASPDTGERPPDPAPGASDVPVVEPAGPVVRAVAPAAALREYLRGDVRESMMWGHVAYMYTCPDHMDLNALAAHLIPVEVFRARHGATPP